MKKQFAILIVVLTFLFLIHGWLTYNLAISLSAKNIIFNNIILIKIFWIFLSSSLIVRVISNLKILKFNNV